MSRKSFLIGILFSGVYLLAMLNAFAGEKQHYYFMVFSNPVSGQEDTYVKWYEGQHVHDLLRIPGFVAAQFFKLGDTQFGEAKPPQRYLMIWEIETDNLPAVFADVNARLKDGRTVISDKVFDFKTYASTVMVPISKRVASDDIKGKSVAEVYAIANGK
jgi:hypothetical protein